MPPWASEPDWDYDEYLYHKHEYETDQDELRYRQRKKALLDQKRASQEAVNKLILHLAQFIEEWDMGDTVFGEALIKMLTDYQIDT